MKNGLICALVLITIVFFITRVFGGMSYLTGAPPKPPPPGSIVPPCNPLIIEPDWSTAYCPQPTLQTLKYDDLGKPYCAQK